MREESVEVERKIAKRDRRFFVFALVGMWLQLIALVLLVKLTFCP